MDLKQFSPAFKAAFIGVLLNIVLSYVVPGLVSDFKFGMFQEVGDMFAHHKRTIISSSAIIGVAVFLSVVIATHLFKGTTY